MSLATIRSALNESWLEGAFGLPTAYENVPFEPTPGTPYASLYVVPSKPDVATMGQGGLDEHDGFMQVDLYYPTGQGDMPAVTKADEIYSYYFAGRTLAYQGQRVRVQITERSQGRVENGWYRLTMTIYYRAYIAR